MKRYEDLIGLTDVKNAQDTVVQAEDQFAASQEARRAKQDELKQAQFRLKEIHANLDKTSRGEDRYLNLLTEEHAVIKLERQLLEDFQALEREERNRFQNLSGCLRSSHEKERERAERVKYWSIIGSALGALIGIIGATINNRMRIRELRHLVQDSVDPGRVQRLLADLSELISSQQSQVRNFISDVKLMLNYELIGPPSSDSNPDVTPNSAFSGHVLTNVTIQDWLAKHSEIILSAIKEQDQKLQADMNEVKSLIAIDRGYSLNQDGVIVYVGPEMEILLDQTERNLEWKMKMQTLANVVLVYGALALSLPVLYAIFKGA